MSILAPTSVNLARSSSDFLLPFLRLPALRFCLGFTCEDGSSVISEDQSRTKWTKNGGITFDSNDFGLPRMLLDGSTGYLSAADAAWNSTTGAFTIIVIAEGTAVADKRYISKEPGGSNRAFELNHEPSTPTTLQFTISATGSTPLTIVNLANGAPAVGTNMIIARYRPSSQLALWGNGKVATNTTSIPAAVFDSTSAINIGRRPAGTGYFGGKLLLVAFAAADISTAHVALLQAHARKFGINA